MFQKKIAKKNVVSSGMNDSPYRPIIWIAMFSRMNCAPISSTLCSLPGTTLGDRSAKKKASMQMERVARRRDEIPGRTRGCRRPARGTSSPRRSRWWWWFELGDDRQQRTVHLATSRSPAGIVHKVRLHPPGQQLHLDDERRDRREHSAAMNATTENQAVWSSSAITTTMMPSRTTNPPRPTA